MEQHMMYFKAEIYDSVACCKRTECGFIYAPSMRDAGEWAETWYGNEIISIYFEPIEESPIFTTEKEATDILERMAW